MTSLAAPTASNRRFDLMLRGGTMLDPTTGIHGRYDIGICSGRIVAVEPSLADHPSETTLDVVGCTITPGLIDLHAHVFTGVCPIVVPADEVCSTSGVTTVIDAGSAGAHTFAGFRRLIVGTQRTRVLGFCHIATIGLAGWPVGELSNMAYADVDAAARTVAEHRDVCPGIKVRQSAGIVGANGLEPLRRAVLAATEAECPIMIHIGDTPGSFGALLDLLRPGDVVTHCFTGAGNALIGEDGRLDPACWEARARGVAFDVGHGSGSCSFDVVQVALAAGFLPDTISTDLHSLSVNRRAVDLPTTMTKFLALGMTFAEVIERVTSRPAAWLRATMPDLAERADLGSIRVGGLADLAVLELLDEPADLLDTTGGVLRATRRLVARHTIRGGRLWGRPYAHLYRA